jgi:hypothetical protein
MSHNTFGVGTVPPPPPPPMPGYPPQPPGPPGESGRRRWPALVAAGIIAGVIASTAAAVITVNARDTTAAAPTLPTPVTVTVAPPAPAAPAALPTSQADRQTCETRAAASRLISEASVAQGVIPEGMTIVDPAVRSNPAWSAGVQKAGSLYTQAGDVLKVTPGATQVLAEAVSTASKALRALGTAYTNFDAANGNVYDIASQSSDAMDVLCGRLAP